MTFALTYATGTISVANGSTAVTGSGVTWTAIREGDSLIDPATGARGIIASIEDTSGALTLLDPWPGTSLTDDAYRIVYDSPARRSGVVVSAAIEELVAAQTILLARRADYLVQDALLDTPPGSPTAGDVYLVGTSPSGAWSGKAGYLATWTSAAAWSFTAPETGMRVVDVSVDPPAFYFRGASAWAIEAVPDSGVLAGTYGSATKVPVLTIGADGRVTAAAQAAAFLGAPGAIFEERQNPGVDGGSSSAGTNNRSLNTIVHNSIVGAELNIYGGWFVLPAGSYYIRAIMIFAGGQRGRAILYNESALSYVLYGTSGFGQQNETTNIQSSIEGIFNIASESLFYIRQYSELGQLYYGKGSNVGIVGVPEVYTRVLIWKV